MTMERSCWPETGGRIVGPPKTEPQSFGANGSEQRKPPGLDSSGEASLETVQGAQSTQEAEQSVLAHLELLERDTELATLQSLVASGEAGGLLMAIEGPPGIGKTALMAEAKSRGDGAGMQVLGARGSELERSFSFGVVRQLFEPLLASLPSEERAELLSGAAALAEPLFDPEQLVAETSTDSSLATLHGLYWLAANLAARRPLLLAIDDLHWTDLPSLRWLAYLLPRMEGLALSVVVGLRPAEVGEEPGLIDQIVSDPLATVIRPAPLSTEAAARFLRETLSPAADDAFCAACEEETGGNRSCVSSCTRSQSRDSCRSRRTCRAFGSSRRALVRVPFPFDSHGFSPRRPLWRKLLPFSATTPIPARPPNWPAWTSRPPPRRWKRSCGSTCCGRSSRSRLFTRSYGPPSTSLSARSTGAADTNERRISSPAPGLSPSVSPPNCSAVLQAAGQRP
jgi:hypothetical protein